MNEIPLLQKLTETGAGRYLGLPSLFPSVGELDGL